MTKMAERLHQLMLRPGFQSREDQELIFAAVEELNRLSGGLDAAIRAANLAIFVIRKQNVMPNDSWKDGFEKDLKTATDARGNGQKDSA